MNASHKSHRHALLGIAAALGFALAPLAAGADELKLTLSGAMEVPPVQTTAAGSGSITVGPDMGVAGRVVTTGVVGTMAHIHQGAPGQNGPVLIPLAKDGDNAWVVPAGARLTEAQYQAYKAGGLYVNVHSAEHKGGEIRAQLQP